MRGFRFASHRPLDLTLPTRSTASGCKESRLLQIGPFLIKLLIQAGARGLPQDPGTPPLPDYLFGKLFHSSGQKVFLDQIGSQQLPAGRKRRGNQLESLSSGKRAAQKGESKCSRVKFQVQAKFVTEGFDQQ
jgi:hypothetical protein